MLNIKGIAIYDIMLKNLNIMRLKLGFQLVCRLLTVVLCYDNTADIKSDTAKHIDKAENLHIVCYAEVASALARLERTCTDSYDDFRLILQLEQHLQLAVGFKAREHAGGVRIVKKLAAEFKIELTAELRNALLYLFRLHFYVFCIVKACFFHLFLLNCRFCPLRNLLLSLSKLREAHLFRLQYPCSRNLPM